MTHTLTKKQLNALKVTLARYGLDVKALAKPRATVVAGDDLAQRIARIRGMKFKTAGIKAAILRSLNGLKADRDFKAANPGDLGAILGMFGVQLRDVQPWGETRWQCLANAKPRLALPAPKGEQCGVFADAAILTTITTQGGHGRARTYKQMNTGCNGYSA